MAEEIKEKIFEFIKENCKKEQLSISEIKRNLKYSYPTVLNWIRVLSLEYKEIKICDYGNIKLVSYEE